MKKIIFVVLLILTAAFCFAADPVEGFWISRDDKTGRATGGWEIYTSGETLYGKLLSVGDVPQDAIAVNCKDSYRGFPLPGKVNTMPVLGTPWMFGLSQDKPGYWKGGNIIDASTGNMYKCRVIFHARDGEKYRADTLEMRGEIGLGIGRSQYWQRCTREEASSLR